MTSMIWVPVFVMYFGTNPEPVEAWGNGKFTNEQTCLRSVQADATDIMNDNRDNFISRIGIRCECTSGSVGRKKNHKRGK